MEQKIFVCLFALFVCFTLAMAQEGSKNDTILLQNVLEGKEVLKLNENAKKMIEDANLNIPSLLMKNDNRHLDIFLDFNNIGIPDAMRIIDCYSMPSAVYSLYILKMAEMDSSLNFTYRFKLTDNEKAQIKIPNTTLSNMIVPLNTDPLHIFGGGNLMNGVNLIFKKQQEQNEKKPMTEIERNQIIKEINSLRQLIDIQ